MPRDNKDLPDEISGAYVPKYDPVDTDIINSIDSVEVETVADSAIRKLVEADARILNGQLPELLTRAESEIVAGEKDKVIADIRATRERIAGLRNRVAAASKKNDGSDLGFTVDLSKKSAVRRAIKKAFGATTTELTFEMYRAALNMKHLLETREKDEYVSGDLD